MPATFTYNYPVSDVVSDNRSHTTKGLLILKECAGTIPNGCEGLWNQGLCGNDEYYAQPFIRGDKIYLQYHFDKSTYQTIQFFIVDCTTLEETPITAQECQTDDTKEDFQNLEIDTISLPKCFYIKAKLYDCIPGRPAYVQSFVKQNQYLLTFVTVNYSIDGISLDPVNLYPSDVAQANIDFNAALQAAFPGWTAVLTWLAGPQFWEIEITTTIPGDAYVGIS